MRQEQRYVFYMNEVVRIIFQNQARNSLWSKVWTSIQKFNKYCYNS